MNNSENISTISPNSSKVDLFSSEITKEYLQSRLRENVIEVTFTKKDGSERVMKCTLNQEILENGPGYEKKTDRVKKAHPNVLPVWDVEASAFRSINIDTVTKVSPT